MKAWRIVRRPYADLSGEGARLYGGRWNSPGVAVVYLAEHPALAMLEILVHLDLDPETLPLDYVLMRIEIPDQVGFHEEPVPLDARLQAGFGDGWLGSGRSALLRVPSMVMPQSFNLLLNPDHRDSSLAKIAEVEPLQFDTRLA